VLDLTLALPTMAWEATNWAVDDTQATGSDHEVIRFEITTTIPNRGPGQETAYNIHDLALALQTYAIAITIHWVLGHTNIKGNKDVDTLAKLATTSPPTMQLPISLSWL
jgi:ribonuclease HI